MKFILASASPRRRELLAQAGIACEVLPSSVEEKITQTITHDIVMELASQKAQDVFTSVTGAAENGNHEDEDLTVIGADTIVSYRGEILGKPSDETEAYDMLSLLADRTHQVYTGVCLLIRKNGSVTRHLFYERTDVTFYPIDNQDLHAYVSSGDPLDKAGAYGIQGSFAIHVKMIQGDYNNVVGLPISRLYQELKKTGCI